MHWFDISEINYATIFNHLLVNIDSILLILFQVKGTAVGFMSICSAVDVELLSRCFDLKPFNGLQKSRGLTPPRGTFMSLNDCYSPNIKTLFKNH